MSDEFYDKTKLFDTPIDERYWIVKRGLLYIVYDHDLGDWMPHDFEESRWEDYTKATEHCILLNKARGKE